MQDFVQTKGSRPAQEIVTNLLTLDQALNAWNSRLPPSFYYSKRNLFEYLVVKEQFSYVRAHALFHQCRLVLHSSIVPRFGGRASRGDFSIDVVRSSARSVLESAKQLSVLADNLAALEWEPASLTPFFGWAMYASAAIHLLSPARPDALAAAHSSLRVLNAMKSFWPHLNVLVSALFSRVSTITSGQYADHPPGDKWDRIQPLLLPPAHDTRSELLSMFQGSSACPSARGSRRRDPSVPSDDFDQELLESGADSLVPYAIGRGAARPVVTRIDEPRANTQITPPLEPDVQPNDSVHPHAETRLKTTEPPLEGTQSWTAPAHPSVPPLQAEQGSFATHALSTTAISMPYMDEELLWEAGLSGFSFDGWLNPSVEWTDLGLWNY